MLSPDDRPGDVQAKIEDYLTAGALAVLVVDPDAVTVEIHRRLAVPVTLGVDETLDLDDIVPGFSCAVREIFS